MSHDKYFVIFIEIPLHNNDQGNMYSKILLTINVLYSYLEGADI